MKRILVLILAFLVVSSVYAFEAGTKNVGGRFEFESIEIDKNSAGTVYFTIYPIIGYFFMNNVCADILLEYTYEDDKDYDKKVNDFGLGIGGRYFYKNIYGGAGFLMEFGNEEGTDNDGHDFEEETSANYLYFIAGYLYPIAGNVYLDAGFSYEMGIGKYGGDLKGTDNEQSSFGFGAGVDIFFK